MIMLIGVMLGHCCLGLLTRDYMLLLASMLG